MAIAGCDFICKNSECAHFNKGISLAGSWPLGDIDSVANSGRVRIDNELQKRIQSYKEYGEKYAVVSLPNKENIPVVGSRIQKWCPKCPAIWNYNIINKETDKTEEFCRQCKEKLMTFDEVIEKGIICPHCKKEMKQKRWCANE
jgi:hypothetical protein